VKFDMVAIPGGTYLMGSPASERGGSGDEGPQHPVTLAPFWMGKCEVTWDEFDEFLRFNVKRKPPITPADKVADAVSRPTPPYADETWGYGREGYPVINISHHAAMQYCLWLSKKTGKVYRLPTEAEWEWACRAGTTTPYSFGDDASKLGEYAWYDKNSNEAPHKVGQKKPNAWGLHDMHGNVGEWCLDHYWADAYSRFRVDKSTFGPVFQPTEKRFSHVARGGSWADKASKVRSGARLGSHRDWLRRDPYIPQSIWWLTDADFVGFRVVRAVREQDNLKGLRSWVTPKSPNE
jgi:formylglycine-generating enzyme required for sulfatase activity